MTAPIKLSGGFLSELSFVYLATGLIETSCDVERSENDFDELIKRGGDYKINKQLERRMDKLKEELVEFIKKYQFAHEQGRAKREKLLRSTLAKAKSAIQLDYLACWILYLKFQPNERSRPINDAFKWITDKENQLFGIIELLGKTKSADKDSEMYELACKIVEEN